MALRGRVVAMVLGMATVVGVGIAQEPGKGANPSRRVPPNFSKVGVTPEQKEKIYAIRGKYQEQIAAAKKKVEDLQAKELIECEGVLTDAQRKQLETIRSEGAKAKAKGE